MEPDYLVALALSTGWPIAEIGCRNPGRSSLIRYSVGGGRRFLLDRLGKVLQGIDAHLPQPTIALHWWTHDAKALPQACVCAGPWFSGMLHRGSSPCPLLSHHLLRHGRRVDKLTASDDAAVDEIPGPIPEFVEFIELIVSCLLLFGI